MEVETAAGRRVFADARREDVPRIVRELVAAGEDVYGVRVVTSTLEDAYLEAVGGAVRAGGGSGGVGVTGAERGSSSPASRCASACAGACS